MAWRAQASAARTSGRAQAKADAKAEAEVQAARAEAEAREAKERAERVAVELSAQQAAYQTEKQALITELEAASERLEAERRTVAFTVRARKRFDRIERCLGRRAELQREVGGAGHGRVRHEALEERKGPHGCILLSELGADGSVEAGGEAHRREAGVGALVHRAAAGVVLLAAQQEAELSHPNNRSDDAERRNLVENGGI